MTPKNGAKIFKMVNVLQNGNAWFTVERGTLPSTYFRQILTKKATKKAQKNFKVATSGLIQGGRGNLLNSHFWRVLKKSHPKSHPKFKMAKWTPKWQHLAQFREGGEIYQILTFGMIWKKSQSKAHIFFKMAKILHTGNTWFESGGEGGIYQIPTNVVWKKPPKADFFFQNG